MNRRQMLTVMAGPLPIVGAAFAVNGWLRPPREPATTPTNRVRSAEYLESAPSAAADEEIAALLEVRCARRAEALQSELDGDCRVRVRAPFVIAGNLAATALDAWYENTIRPASEAMASRYFRVPPNRAITVLLFSDKQSYNHYAEKLYGDRGLSVFGYYKPTGRILVMNIGTGGGTLVHELTHALMDFDFPRAPDWFNEGLASLHEECRFRRDTKGPWLEGLVNWRLSILQRAIRAGRLRSVRSLVAGDDFRRTQVGVNYAHARYFCMYLQQVGLLERFFGEFRSAHRRDPLGLQTLKRVLPGKSWHAVNREFTSWAIQLKCS